MSHPLAGFQAERNLECCVQYISLRGVIASIAGIVIRQQACISATMTGFRLFWQYFE